MGVQVYGCISVEVYKCLGVQVYECTGAQNVWVYKCTKCMGVQVTFTNVWVYMRIGVPVMSVQGCTTVQV